MNSTMYTREMQQGHQRTNQLRRRNSGVSSIPAGWGGSHWRSAGTHHHSSSACRDGICPIDVNNCPFDIEEEIVQHPSSIDCFNTVSLLLRLPVILLRSVEALRETSEWQAGLQSCYNSLLSSPPKELFELILRLRCNEDFKFSNTIEQLQLHKREAMKRKLEAGKTAPKGLAYQCPSSNCRKPYQKSGHARNHVKEVHPEYLVLHPGCQPQDCMVPVKSLARAPDLSRVQSDTNSRRHSACPQAPQAPVSTYTHRNGRLFTPTNKFKDVCAISSSSSGPGLLGCYDEEPQLTRSRSNSRPSPRQPATPHAHEDIPLASNRQRAVRHIAPHLAIKPSKRHEDPFSSTESFVAESENGARRAPQGHRRHPKRHSTGHVYLHPPTSWI